MSAWLRLRDLLWLDGLIAPPECLWCASPVEDDQDWCDACYATLFRPYYHCRKCAMPLNEALPNTDCIRCRGQRWSFSRVIALGPYGGQLRELVLELKKPRRDLLWRAVGRELADRLRQEGWANLQRVGVVPVPNYWTHRLLGSSNVAGELAQQISRHLQIPLITGKIVRIRNTAKQGMLTWGQRKENVRGAFQVRRPKSFSGRHVILVDDVMTSGATLAEIARLLKRAGCEQIYAAVVARGTGTRDLPAPDALGSIHRNNTNQRNVKNDA